MRRFVEEDLSGAEFRECELDGARFAGVVMRGAQIDGLVDSLVVNGVEVTGFVEAELDRRHPVRVLIRSDEPADLHAAHRELVAGWRDTVHSLAALPPGSDRKQVDGEWSMVQTLRHLVFVHDSWFRRCVLGMTEPFTGMGLGPDYVPEGEGLDPAADPSLAEVLEVRARQAAELDQWLGEVSADQLQAPAPVPDDGRWPPYAAGRSTVQCLRTVLTEEHEHRGFCVRDLATLAARAG